MGRRKQCPVSHRRGRRARAAGGVARGLPLMRQTVTPAPGAYGVAPARLVGPVCPARDVTPASGAHGVVPGLLSTRRAGQPAAPGAHGVVSGTHGGGGQAVAEG